MTYSIENIKPDENCNVFQFLPDARLAPVYVLVSGLPGSGKSTLAPPLAAALGLPMFSKDVIKEALWDALGPYDGFWGDREWSQMVGTAAAAALESLARASSGAVIDHFVHFEHTDVWARLPGIVEVHCVCGPDLARKRYGERRRHASHFDADKIADSYDFWIEEDATRPPVGPRLDVDTTQPVDVAAVAEWVRQTQP